jgi:proteasome lid subunit RPN8/RPN11
MKHNILKSQLKQMIKESVLLAKNGGIEICGLLVYNGYFIEMIRLRNKTKKGGGFSFYLQEADFIEKSCTKMNHEIIGTFHSHPYDIAKPGESDLKNAFENEYMLVIDVIKQKARLWKITNKKAIEKEFSLI